MGNPKINKKMDGRVKLGEVVADLTGLLHNFPNPCLLLVLLFLSIATPDLCLYISNKTKNQKIFIKTKLIHGKNQSGSEERQVILGLRKQRQKEEKLYLNSQVLHHKKMIMFFVLKSFQRSICRTKNLNPKSPNRHRTISKLHIKKIKKSQKDF